MLILDLLIHKAIPLNLIVPQLIDLQAQTTPLPAFRKQCSPQL